MTRGAPILHLNVHFVDATPERLAKAMYRRIVPATVRVDNEKTAVASGAGARGTHPTRKGRRGAANSGRATPSLRWRPLGAYYPKTSTRCRVLAVRTRSTAW